MVYSEEHQLLAFCLFCVLQQCLAFADAHLVPGCPVQRKICIMYDPYCPCSTLANYPSAQGSKQPRLGSARKATAPPSPPHTPLQIPQTPCHKPSSLMMCMHVVGSFAASLGCRIPVQSAVPVDDPVGDPEGSSDSVTSGDCDAVTLQDRVAVCNTVSMGVALLETLQVRVGAAAADAVRVVVPPGPWLWVWVVLRVTLGVAVAVDAGSALLVAVAVGPDTEDVGLKVMLGVGVWEKDGAGVEDPEEGCVGDAVRLKKQRGVEVVVE